MRDRSLYGTARANLKMVNQQTKEDYREKMEGYLMDNNPRKMWRGIQVITNKTVQSPKSSPQLQHHLSLQEHEVRKNLRAVNPRKAVGPNSIPGAMVKAQVKAALGRVAGLDPYQAVQPAPTLATCSVRMQGHYMSEGLHHQPLSQKTAIDSLSNYRHFALKSVVMKCLEGLVSQHIAYCLPPSFDPHQFSYRANWSTDDATAMTFHRAQSHWRTGRAM